MYLKEPRNIQSNVIQSDMDNIKIWCKTTIKIIKKLLKKFARENQNMKKKI